MRPPPSPPVELTYSFTVESETAYGQSSNAGEDDTVARGDHTHGTPTALVAATSVTAETSYEQSSNAGSASTFSKGDHTHGTPYSNAPMFGCHVSGTDLTFYFIPGLAYNYDGTATPSFTQDYIYAIPFTIVDRSPVVSTLACHVGLGQTGGKARVGIYDAKSKTNMYPDDLVVESGELTCTSIGIKSGSVSQALVAGNVYWAAFMCNDTDLAFYGFNGNMSRPIGDEDLTLNTFYAIKASQAFGTMPAKFPGSPTLLYIGGDFPVLGIKFSS